MGFGLEAGSCLGLTESKACGFLSSSCLSNSGCLGLSDLNLMDGGGGGAGPDVKTDLWSEGCGRGGGGFIGCRSPKLVPKLKEAEIVELKLVMEQVFIGYSEEK